MTRPRRLVPLLSLLLLCAAARPAPAPAPAAARPPPPPPPPAAPPPGVGATPPPPLPHPHRPGLRAGQRPVPAARRDVRGVRLAAAAVPRGRPAGPAIRGPPLPQPARLPPA